MFLISKTTRNSTTNSLDDKTTEQQTNEDNEDFDFKINTLGFSQNDLSVEVEFNEVSIYGEKKH
ncbi:hypothetical protein Mgra_00004354 [Meloidogyne graminicola]|uniref:SHSP domain-containing protein n=1 Tax=Meloidogyne graminicola TaxID=189291 RepID=A0A8S9ZSP8_9BILA|nr:hypothetical protein Mgra_00004354 [Meloidogyne graminicola]